MNTCCTTTLRNIWITTIYFYQRRGDNKPLSRHRFLSCFGIQAVTPLPKDVDFFLWWQQAGDRISAGALPGFNTLVVLGAWSIWRTRDDAVFDRIAPSVDRALLLAQDKAELWMLAGAKGLSAVVAFMLPKQESYIATTKWAWWYCYCLSARL